MTSALVQPSVLSEAGFHKRTERSAAKTAVGRGDDPTIAASSWDVRESAVSAACRDVRSAEAASRAWLRCQMITRKWMKQ